MQKSLLLGQIFHKNCRNLEKIILFEDINISFPIVIPYFISIILKYKARNTVFKGIYFWNKFFGLSLEIGITRITIFSNLESKENQYLKFVDMKNVKSIVFNGKSSFKNFEKIKSELTNLKEYIFVFFDTDFDDYPLSHFQNSNFISKLRFQEKNKLVFGDSEDGKKIATIIKNVLKCFKNLKKVKIFFNIQLSQDWIDLLYEVKFLCFPLDQTNDFVKDYIPFLPNLKKIKLRSLFRDWKTICSKITDLGCYLNGIFSAYFPNIKRISCYRKMDFAENDDFYYYNFLITGKIDEMVFNNQEVSEPK